MLEDKKEKEETKGFLASDLLSMLKKQLRALLVIIFFIAGCFSWHKYGMAMGVSKL